MDPTNLFTDDATRRIRDLVRRVEGTPTGVPGPDPAANQLPPETLFALVPSTGIPARSGTTLGNAVCDLYRDAAQTFGSTTRVLQPVQIAGNQVTRVIHNALTTAVDGSGGDVYVPITRTKHGAWLAIPECPCGCTIYSTGFYAAADLDDWTITGTGSVSGTVLELTGTSTTAILDTPHPQYPYPPRVRVDVKGGTGAELRIFLSYAITAGIIVELRPNVTTGCGQLDIYQLTGGSESLISGTHGIPGLIADQWHSVAACYDPRDDSITVRIRTYGGRYTTIRATITGHVDGEYSGLGTGDAHSGTGYFDNFRFERLWYYGDGEQDDWASATFGYYYYADQVIECGSCAAPGCEYINATFTEDTDYYSGETNSLCEWLNPGSYWEIDGDNQVLRSLAAHTLLHGLQNPDDPHDEDEILLTFRAAAAGDIVEAIICAVDTSNYLAAQVEVGTGGGAIGIVRLVQYTAGSPTTISDEHRINLVEAGEWYNLWLYYDGYTLIARLTGVSGDTADAMAYVESNVAVTCSGRYVGLSTDSAGLEVSQYQAFWCGSGQVMTCVDYRAQGSDRFGGDGYSLDTNWTLLSGDSPAIVAASGETDLTLAEWAAGEAGVILSLDPVQPSIEDTYRVSASFQDDYIISEATGSGAKVGIVFASDSDGTDYYLAEVELAPNADWIISLYAVNSGTPTLLDSRTFTPPSVAVSEFGWLRLGVCWYYGNATASLYYGGYQIVGSIIWKGGLSAYGRHYGLSVEASATYPARAAANAFVKIVDDWSDVRCLPCVTNCSFCEDNEQPNLILATVAGIVDAPTLYWVSEGASYSVIWSTGWSTLNTEHYCVPLDTECYWQGPTVPMAGTAVGRGDQAWCGRVRVWFESDGYHIYLKAALWIIPNGPIEGPLAWSDCDDALESAWNTAYSQPYGKYTFSKQMVAVGNYIDCFSDLDGETLTSAEDGDVTITLQVPG